MPDGLTVLLPVYNEEAGLEDAIKTIQEYLTSQLYDFEIVIVDDASTDRSYAIACQLAEREPRIKLFKHAKNCGPCSGIKTGPKLATKEWILLLPADLAIPLSDISLLWNTRLQCDIALGYVRDLCLRETARRAQSAIYSKLIELLFDLRFRQINYVALYRRSLFDRLKLTSEGVALHAEILIRSCRMGARIIEVGLGYTPRTTGKASGSKPLVVLKTLRELLKLKFSF